MAANIVTNAGTNVSGNIPSFSGTTGKIIQEVHHATKIVIEDIKVRMPDNTTRMIDPVVFKVKLN